MLEIVVDAVVMTMIAMMKILIAMKMNIVTSMTITIMTILMITTMTIMVTTIHMTMGIAVDVEKTMMMTISHYAHARIVQMMMKMMTTVTASFLLKASHLYIIGQFKSSLQAECFL